MNTEEVDKLARELPTLTLHGCPPVATTMALAARVVELLESVERLTTVRDVLSEAISAAKFSQRGAERRAAASRETANEEKKRAERAEYNATRRCSDLANRAHVRRQALERLQDRITAAASRCGWESKDKGREVDADAALDYMADRLQKTAHFEDVERLQNEALDALQVVADTLDLGPGTLTEVVPEAMREWGARQCPTK